MFDSVPAHAEALNALYEDRDYFVKEDSDPSGLGYAGDYLADRSGIEAKFERVLQHLERYATPGRLLDVGAGPGFLLAAAHRRGWRATGLDLNPWAVKHGREILGVDLHADALDDSALAGEAFDAVTLMDVIEHVPDPDSLLRNVARVLRPEGAFAILTPDAGALVSRLLGRRWPEARRPGEHLVLFSLDGLTTALRRHGLEVSGWHSIGKVAPLATLVDDAALAAPAIAARLSRALAGTRLGDRTVDLDPHTKFVIYGRRRPARSSVSSHRPARIPKAPEELAGVESAILEELEQLAKAERLTSWLYDEFAHLVPGATVLEVGAGIGTFSELMLAHGAREMLLIEPEASCAAVLEQRFEEDSRVRVSREPLPHTEVVTPDHFDLVVCQNVLEHIADDVGALSAMAGALKPGGRLALVVPAGPRLFGPLDDAYGHWRRYDRATLSDALSAAGLEVTDMRSVNALGIAGWWVKNRRTGARIGSSSLRAYELLVAGWRPIEERARVSVGLSLVCIAKRPTREKGDPAAPVVSSSAAQPQPLVARISPCPTD